MNQDSYWMKKALDLAGQAAQLGEIPVGAIITLDGVLVSEAYNLRESHRSAIAHAELLAIEAACRKLGRWRLSGCTLYVTLEPCLMCAGAVVQSRVDKVVYGCEDPKAGAVRSLYKTLNDPRLNHRCEVVEGVCATESSNLLKSFFADLRQKKSGLEPHP